MPTRFSISSLRSHVTHPNSQSGKGPARYHSPMTSRPQESNGPSKQKGPIAHHLLTGKGHQTELRLSKGSTPPSGQSRCRVDGCPSKRHAREIFLWLSCPGNSTATTYTCDIGVLSLEISLGKQKGGAEQAQRPLKRSKRGANGAETPYRTEARR